MRVFWFCEPPSQSGLVLMYFGTVTVSRDPPPPSLSPRSCLVLTLLFEC